MSVKKTRPHRWQLTSSHALLVLSTLLSLLGLVFIFDASLAESFTMTGDPYALVIQQARWLAVGFLSMIVVSRVPGKWWQKIAPLVYFVGLGLLILVAIPGVGTVYNGARRWLSVGGQSFQPVELFKFSMVIFFSDWLTRHQRIKPFLLLTAIPVGLLLAQPDLGSALIVLGIAFGMYFVAGADLKVFGGVALVGIIAISLLIATSEYRLRRVTTYLNPEEDRLGAGFHIHQITLALGNGGWLGQGIGQSRQKFSYIPEPSTDSIFSIIAEEVGFLGGTAMVALFAAFCWFGSRVIATNPPGSYQSLLGTGMLMWIMSQTLLNLAAVVALVPLTGLPLPFISYGGTALVMLLTATGVLAASRSSHTP
jgi:cell division protein FtsW